MPKPDEALILVGQAARVHGLKGEFSVVWHADSPSLLDHVPGLLLRRKNGTEKWCTVRSWRMHQDRILLLLDQMDGRDAADVWRGADILVREADLPEPADDEVYIFQLEGLDVHLPDGSRLGRIEAIATEPTEVWTILTDDGREVLFPAAEEFVTGIDLDAGRVDIDPPEGLLDIYLGE